MRPRTLHVVMPKDRYGARALTALLLTGGLVAVPGLTTVGTAAAEPGDLCAQAPDVAPDAASALGVAEACAKDVEVVQERTEHNTVFAQPDGTMRLDVSTLAVRTKQDGEWVDVDPTVVAGTGGLTVAAAVTPMMFSDGRDGVPLATIERDGHRLTFDVPFDLPAPTVDGDQITYTGLIPGVDLVVTVAEDATGFSEVLRVATPEAAADPRLAELAFPVQVSDGLELEPEMGGFVAADDDGESVFTSPQPAMWDSREDPSARFARLVGVMAVPDASSAQGDGSYGPDRTRGPVGGERLAPLPADVAPDAVTIIPDTAMIDDPSTVWPVFIDPSVSGSRVEWMAVRDTLAGAYMFDPDQGVGLCNSTAMGCSRVFKSRLLWKFGGLGTIGSLQPGEVLSTTFAAVGTHAYDCTARPINLFRVDNWNSATGWPGGPTWVHQSTQNVTHKSSCAGNPVRWIEFPALEAGRAVAQYDANQLTLGLATDEGSMAYWKRYRNDATLSIVYNRAPLVPTNVSFSLPAKPCVMGAGRPVVNTVNPVLTSRHVDPDGDAVSANVDVYPHTLPSGTANILWHWREPAQASGTTQPVMLRGVQHGGIYRVQVNSVDSQGWGGSGAMCEFEVDTVKPNTPTVSATKYTSTLPSGGIGVADTFTLGPNGSTDVVRYLHSFDSTALDKVATGTSPSISFTPTRTGSHVLYVTAVDRADNTSATTQAHRFEVAFPATVTWNMDGTSTTSEPGVGGDGASAYPLTLTGVARTNGVTADLGMSTTDRALLFDSTTAGAATTAPPMSTQQSYSVSAFVKPTAATGSAIALSQDGTNVAGFELGYRPCTDGSGSCWSFAMNTADASTTTATSVVSPQKVQAGAWAHITGVHNAGTKTLDLYVCTLGTDDWGDATVTVHPAVSAPFTANWNATGPFRIGRVKGPTAPVWSGAIDKAVVSRGAVDVAKVRTSCTPVAP